LINKYKYNTSGFTPGIIDYFKDDQNQLFGLTPTFIGIGLYYNKSLFSKNGIPSPTDSMTWDEVFQHAKRFPTSVDSNKPQFGYYDKDSGNPFLMALRIGEGSGLSFYTNNTFTFSSKSWENIFQNVTDCFKSRVCADKKLLSSSFGTDRDAAEKRNYPFLAGNIAMAIHDSSLYRTLTANKDRFPDLDWGVIPLPSNADHLGVSNGIMMNDIFSIPTNAGALDAAWEFIQYVCGEEYTRLLPNINPQELPARVPSEWSDEKLKPFYKLERITNTTINTLRSLPVPVITKMDEVSQKQVADILADKITVPDALKAIEFELQQTLDSSEK
jgi:multiple sugar transport system substrate-binding protein